MVIHLSDLTLEQKRSIVTQLEAGTKLSQLSRDLGFSMYIIKKVWYARDGIPGVENDPEQEEEQVVDSTSAPIIPPSQDVGKDSNGKDDKQFPPEEAVDVNHNESKQYEEYARKQDPQVEIEQNTRKSGRKGKLRKSPESVAPVSSPLAVLAPPSTPTSRCKTRGLSKTESATAPLATIGMESPPPSSTTPKIDEQPSTSKAVKSGEKDLEKGQATKKQKLDIPEEAVATATMDSDLEDYADPDSGNASSGDDVPFEERRPDGAEDDYPFKVLSTEEIVQHMIECIREANTVLQLPSTTMRMLLNHFKWDREKLLEAYYDSDQDKLFRDAKIINPNTTKKPSKIAPNSIEDCEICYMQKPGSMMYGMECGHRFCIQCWNAYLTTKIKDEGMGQTISCAAHDCPILIDDGSVMKLLTDQAIKLRYQHLITNSFVECHRLMRWCPSPDCSNAVRVQWNDWRPVTCSCGFVFCFQCGHTWHDPVKCVQLRKWLKKCDDDSETSNWIAANTKECPKCQATIEKDGGCNHMVCKNQNCKVEFCWVCLGPWEPHGSSWYNCNRYDENEAKAARDAQEKSRAALQRYLHYCNRYMNHMQSLKFENKLYASIKEKMEEMQQHNMSWIEVQFLKKAVDILCQCRQTLMYTYVFAYYLKKTNQSIIFEDNQRDLESATEKLSEYLEREIDADNLVDIKQKVQDKYRYCEKRREALLQHVYEGYDKDWWCYNDAS